VIALGVIKKLLHAHILYCPICNAELNWFSYTEGNINHLFCKECEEYYRRDHGSKLLITDDQPKRANEYYERKLGLKIDEDYFGIPTHIFYKPKWIKLIEQILKKNL
jgi:uncharacterized protein YbaR (Trm112 family)